jgi:hypothetical protein
VTASEVESGAGLSISAAVPSGRTLPLTAPRRSGVGFGSPAHGPRVNRPLSRSPAWLSISSVPQQAIGDTGVAPVPGTGEAVTVRSLGEE